MSDQPKTVRVEIEFEDGKIISLYGADAQRWQELVSGMSVMHWAHGGGGVDLPWKTSKREREWVGMVAVGDDIARSVPCPPGPNPKLTMQLWVSDDGSIGPFRAYDADSVEDAKRAFHAEMMERGFSYRRLDFFWGMMFLASVPANLVEFGKAIVEIQKRYPEVK